MTIILGIFECHIVLTHWNYYYKGKMVDVDYNEGSADYYGKKAKAKYGSTNYKEIRLTIYCLNGESAETTIHSFIDCYFEWVRTSVKLVLNPKGLTYCLAYNVKNT